MIFEEAELSELQTEIKEVMDEVSADRFDSFRGETRTRETDAPDQFVTTPNQILTDYPCDYRLTNNQERFLAGLDSSISYFTVTVSGGINLRERDFLTIKAKGSEPAKELIVRSILKKSNALKWKVICIAK